MNRRDDVNASNNGRMQWGTYGFLAGILLGVLMGWFFAGFIGAFVRVAMVILALAPLVLLYLAWRRYVVPLLRPPVERQYVQRHYPVEREYVDPVGAIETRAVVHGAVREPQPR